METFKCFFAFFLALFLVWSLDTWITTDAMVWLSTTFSNTDPDTYTRFMWLLLLAALPLGIAIIYRQFFPIKLLIGVYVSAFLLLIVWGDPRMTPFAIVSSAILATIGWLYQQHHMRELQKKQHTLNVLVQMRQSDMFNKHMNNLLNSYPPETNIPPTDLDTLIKESKQAQSYIGGTWPVLLSIKYIANYYEFLAAAVKQGDMDKNLLEDTIGGIMSKFYEKVKPIIDDKLELDENGEPTNPLKTYVHYYWLINHW